VEAIRATLPDTARLLYAGKEQRSLVKGYLSATTDGIIISSNPEFCLNLDFKSFDPRMEIKDEKPAHAFQVQAQMGLIRELTPYRPDMSKVVYVNASFWDDIREPEVRFDPRVYAAAHARAEIIMTENNPLRLQPEGKMAGGKECAHCPWASRCADVQVAGVPTNYENTLNSEDANHLEFLRDKERMTHELREDINTQYAEVTEQIKQFLREHNTRRYVGEGWSVSYSVVEGRQTLDTKAIEAAGIDLAPYYKTGKSSDRLVIR